MAGELVDGLPEDLRAWVESRADETGRSSAEVLARAVTVQRLLDEYDGPLPDPSTFDAEAFGSAARAGDAPARTDLAERVDALEAEFDGKLTDVRERVVQVKREADAKAGADHDHPELRASAEATADVAADVDRLRESVSDLEARFEAGVDNYETVVSHLTDAVDDLDGKTTTLASTLADLRTRTREAEARRTAREAADELKREANRAGVGTASCGSCGATVRVALLTRPSCPECGGAYDGVEAASGIAGLLGRGTLVAGPRPDSADDAGTATAGTGEREGE